MFQPHRLVRLAESIETERPALGLREVGFVLPNESRRDRQKLAPPRQPCGRITPMRLGLSRDRAQAIGICRLGADDFHLALKLAKMRASRQVQKKFVRQRASQLGR